MSGISYVCGHIWSGSLDLNWCGQKAHLNWQDVCVIHDALQDFCLCSFVSLQLRCHRRCKMQFACWIIARVRRCIINVSKWSLVFWELFLMQMLGVAFRLRNATNLWWCPTNYRWNALHAKPCIKRYYYSFCAAVGYSCWLYYKPMKSAQTYVIQICTERHLMLIFDSVRCRAKSSSWNNPSLQSLAWFPTWEYCLSCFVLWM